MGRETLRHNPLNAVTAVVERVTDAAGHTLIRKELRRPDPTGTEGTPGAWAASTDPEHWNYWRREADAYLCEPLREGLKGAGLGMAAADVEETDTGVVLWLEEVAGTPGTQFSLAGHAAIAAALGRWQAQGPLTETWASRRFLWDYSASKPARYELVEDDAAWQQPLIANCWPIGLRDGWRRLLANRETLLTIMESLPRTRSHLDVWVSNEIRRPTGLSCYSTGPSLATALSAKTSATTSPTPCSISFGQRNDSSNSTKAASTRTYAGCTKLAGAMRNAMCASVSWHRA